MGFTSIKNVLAQATLASPQQLDEWNKAWRVAVENGSTETLFGFYCREIGTTEEAFLQKLAEILKWPYLDLPKLEVSNEARAKISTKVAFQFSVLPTKFENNVLQVAVSN